MPGSCSPGPGQWRKRQNAANASVVAKININHAGKSLAAVNKTNKTNPASIRATNRATAA